MAICLPCLSPSSGHDAQNITQAQNISGQDGGGRAQFLADGATGGSAGVGSHISTNTCCSLQE